jgi:two-component system phosphate regulon sensor histidine kinase PhoR
MIWKIATAVALLVGAGICLFWKRKFSGAKVSFENQVAALKKSHERELEQMLTRRQALFDSLIEGLLLLDQDGRIQFANRAFFELFELEDNVRGKTIVEILRVPELIELIQRLKTESRVLDYELILPGAQERRFNINAAVVQSESRQAGNVLVFHDLTRLKQLEKTREEFVANVSHELRTPLSMFKGYVETLLGSAKDEPETCEKFLRIVDRHVDRLAFLIEDLLTISKLESGRMVLNRESVSLNSVAQNTFEELRERAAARQIKFINELQNETAWADRERLRQVFFNLLDNAIKYGSQGGEVSVRARTISQNEIEVQVQNEGAGIPPGAIDRIFERFYRVDKARSREAGGTGLGLAIVKHIVLANGGRAWAQSEPERGATFFFTLPISALPADHQND